MAAFELRPASALWGNSDFLKLWSAQALSALGARITRTALPVIAIGALNASATEAAVLALLSVAPGVLAAVVAGGYIERHPKRPVMIAADLMRAALLVSIPGAAAIGSLTMAQMYAVAGLTGALSIVFDIADRSFLPVIVDKDHILDGNAKLQSTDSFAEAAGPAMSGALIALLSAPLAVASTVATYLWSAFQLAGIGTREPVRDFSDARLLQDVRLGFATALRHPVIGPQFAAEGFRHFFNGIFFALYMIAVLGRLKFSPFLAGIVISLGGVGALAGSRFAPALRVRLGPHKALVVSFLGVQTAVLLVPLAMVDGAPSLLLLGLQQLLGDACLAAYLISAISLRQEVMPQDRLARVNAAFNVAAGTAASLGAVVAAAYAERWGVRTLIALAAAGGVLSGLFFAFAKGERMPAQSR